MKYLSFNQRFKTSKNGEMYIKNAPTLYELRHSKHFLLLIYSFGNQQNNSQYSCKNNKVNKNKLSLIGTVQHQMSELLYMRQLVSITHRYGSTHIYVRNVTEHRVSISHRYGSTSCPYWLASWKRSFQSLIGTVQLLKNEFQHSYLCVSITHGYGSTLLLSKIQEVVL